MSILRRHHLRRFGTGFALFALGLQFLLSFGYIHSHLPVDYTHAHDFSVLADPTTQLASSDSQNSSPDQKGNAGAAHEHCTLCASIYLAGTLTPSSAPEITLALHAASAVEPQAQGFLASSIPFRLRLTRAPPLA